MLLRAQKSMDTFRGPVLAEAVRTVILYQPTLRDLFRRHRGCCQWQTEGRTQTTVSVRRTMRAEGETGEWYIRQLLPVAPKRAFSFRLLRPWPPLFLQLTSALSLPPRRTWTVRYHPAPLASILLSQALSHARAVRYQSHGFATERLSTHRTAATLPPPCFGAGHYTLFGEVVSGMEVAWAINKLASPTGQPTGTKTRTRTPSGDRDEWAERGGEARRLMK